VNFPGSCGTPQIVPFEPCYLAVDPRVFGGEGLLDARRFSETCGDQRDVAASQSESPRHAALDIACEFRSKGVGVHLSCQAIGDSVEDGNRNNSISHVCQEKKLPGGLKGVVSSDYGARIKKVRRGVLHLTQSQLARKLGTTQSNVAKWESGVYPPAPAQFVALGALLGETEDGSWFIKQSGVPFLGQIDLRPGGLTRQMREFEVRRSRSPASPEQDIDILWDSDFMTEVIDAVNENLKQMGKTPYDVNYPQLVVAAYNVSYYDRATLRATVKQISKIA
jgi:transcriptional regulator with XRE-family HTH domain